MYQLFKKLSAKEIMSTQLPVFSLSLLIAELFYKFHSFVLEGLAFIATWFVIDMIVSFGLKKIRNTNTVNSQVNAKSPGQVE